MWQVVLQQKERIVEVSSTFHSKGIAQSCAKEWEEGDKYNDVRCRYYVEDLSTDGPKGYRSEKWRVVRALKSARHVVQAKDETDAKNTYEILEQIFRVDISNGFCELMIEEVAS